MITIELEKVIRDNKKRYKVLKIKGAYEKDELPKEYLDDSKAIVWERDPNGNYRLHCLHVDKEAKGSPFLYEESVYTVSLIELFMRRIKAAAACLKEINYYRLLEEWQGKTVYVDGEEIPSN